MNSYERKRRICKMIVLVLGILSINNIILTIRNYSYAYFEKNVKTGVKLKITTLDEMPVKGEIATKVIKDTVVAYANASKDDFGGGLVAVNTNGTLYNETAGNEEIREYRYSGLNVNNYIYYNCKDKDEEGHDVEQNVDNCEVWRIVGVFKDDNGAEHLKIVRNNVLTRDMFPVTYTVSGIEYNIQGSSGDTAYWNKKKSRQDCFNDWATAGLQYWLNAGSDEESKTTSDGYINYLSKNAKSMIEEKAKYYLGTLTNVKIDYIKDTIAEAYANERAVSECEGGKGPNSNNGSYLTFADTPNCRVWSGNQAIWEGSIALLYPSDYGYTVSDEYWTNTMLSSNGFTSTVVETSWLQTEANHESHEWFLSPLSSWDFDMAAWGAMGDLLYGSSTNSVGVRPTLYLKSQAIIFDGDGSSEKPYKIKIGN